jgi:ADP-heptose:LPS heptosyltransferase
MAKVLIIRLSSFGDVAMAVPVVYSVAHAYPADKFVVLTKAPFAQLFDSLADNVETLLFDPKQHAGFLGVVKLRMSIRKIGFTHIADLHDVLRSKVIRFGGFQLNGPLVGHIHKGRKEKALLIRTKKLGTPLPSTVERYRKVLINLGFDFNIGFKSLYNGKAIDYTSLNEWQPTGSGKRIGIAPFARHPGKIYPPGKMEKVIEALSTNPDNTIFLFGGKGEEEDIMRQWEAKYPRVVCTAGLIDLRRELLLMHSLDVLVSMDSANMHLASLAGATVVSVWGSTHPSLGFYGYGQRLENAIQIDLECRPCSVYGNIPCARKDYACLNWIEPQMIVKRVREVLG